MKKLNLFLAVGAIVLAAVIASQTGVLVGLLMLTLVSNLLKSREARLCAVTLSVPELAKEILDAVKTETPEVFGEAGMALDLKSTTAVLGDRIIAKLALLPEAADYDPAPKRGFYNGAQDVTTLMRDIPIVLDRLPHVPIKISLLTRLASKGVDLQQAATKNYAHVIGKRILDEALTLAVSGTVTHSITTSTAIMNLDTMEAIRSQMNAQKMNPTGRFCYINTPLASALGGDDRLKSSLYYDQRNGEQGIRIWKNVAGFSWIREYPDMPAGNGSVGGLCGDRRLVCLSVRRIQDINETARALGIREVMKFHNLTDEETGLEMAGIAWEESGTGDDYFSAAILYGLGVGNQFMGAGALTDDAGCVIRTI